MRDSNVINLCWKEGYDAFGEGYRDWDNPYQTGTIEHEAWSDGFEDGSEDSTQ